MSKPVKIFNVVVLTTISGIFLGLSVSTSNIWYISFVAFMPLLFAAEMALSFKKYFSVFILQLLTTLVVFYLIAGFWVVRTANLGFLFGIILVVPFLVLISPYILFLNKSKKIAPLYFIVAWLSAEMIQSYFIIGTPFYNLGNNPGSTPSLIQWYEYTGSAGGTLWILAVNFLLYKVVFTLINREKVKKGVIIALLSVFLCPMIFSVLIFRTYKEKGKLVKVMVVHPATDCYNMKYNTEIFKLMDYYLDIIKPGLDEEVKYVVLPETAITNGGWLHELEKNIVLDHFNIETIRFKDLCLITGAVTYKAIDNVNVQSNFEKNPQLKYSDNYKKWYYTYNTALQVEKYKRVQYRTKQELVPFQEYTPLPGILPNILPLGVNFQFSSGEDKKSLFTSSGNKIAAIICYEAAFGSLYRKYSKEGAEAFFELLNEGWYFNTKVSEQFLNLSVIRAIENRKDIARSSNMGISCFINQKGEVLSQKAGSEAGFIIGEMKFNKQKTFSGIAGNYPEYLSVVLMLIMLGKLIISNERQNK
jgi:apolipoprotein N-acyltransferase